MPKQQERVLIAGGGIGGLAASIALARRGIESEVLERSRFSEETGAGIQLGPNATRALAALGVLEAIGARAFKPDAIAIYDGLTGRKLSSLPLGKSVEDRYGAPYLTLHRADLHAGLRAAAEKLVPVTLRPGFEVSAVDTQGADVLVRGIDGSEANGAALVGADGLWSAVRPLIAPAASLRFTGATAWRTLLPREDLPAPFNASEVGLWLGPRAHLVHYPVRGGADLNVVAVTEGGAALQGWNQTSSAETLLAGFTGWNKDSRSLLQRAAVWRSWSLYGLTGLRRFSEGRIALLGDAAHPVLPYLAQGAALAIEDAVALAEAVAASPGDPAQAFRRYAERRRARASGVQRLSRRFGRIYHFGGLLRLARNLVLERRSGTAALADLDWLYGTPR
jgi:salicylate hydroxylase